MTYSSIVYCKTIHIALTIAAMNDLQVKYGDVLNAYITVTVMELISTTIGPKFGNDQGKKENFVRVLYGLKPSGAAFRKQLVEYMSGLGYKPCLADPDLSLSQT